jgi:hypothetical protein
MSRVSIAGTDSRYRAASCQLTTRVIVTNNLTGK